MKLGSPITTRVMTIEDIKAECEKLGVAPSRPKSIRHIADLHCEPRP